MILKYALVHMETILRPAVGSQFQWTHTMQSWLSSASPVLVDLLVQFQYSVNTVLLQC